MNRWRNLHKRLNDSVRDPEPRDNSVFDSLFIELEQLIIEDEHCHDIDRQPVALECIRFFLTDFMSVGSLPRRIRALLRAARWTDRRGFPEEATALYQQILHLTDYRDELYIQSLEELGEIHRRSGDLDQAVERQMSAAESARSGGIGQLEAHALNNLGVIAIEKGCLAEAERYLESALECLEWAPEPLLEGHVYNNLGVICCIKGRPDLGSIHFGRALFFRDRAGDRNGFAETIHNIGLTYVEMNRLDEAEDYLDRALSMARGLGRMQSVGNIRLAQSELFLKRNDAVIGGRIALEAMKILEKLGDKLGMADAKRLQAEAEFMNGRANAALEIAQEALALNRQYLHMMGEAQCCELMYRIARSERDVEKAEYHRQAAVETWSKLGNDSAVSRLQSSEETH